MSTITIPITRADLLGVVCASLNREGIKHEVTVVEGNFIIAYS